MNKDILFGQRFWDKSAPYFGRTRGTKFIVYPALKRLCGIVKDKRILDIGCATGELAIDLARAGADVVGIDFSRKMIEIAIKDARHRRVGQVKFLAADARDLKIIDNQKFDLIIINVLFPHLKEKKDIEKVLREAVNRLEKGGKILLAEPHPCFDYLLRAEVFKGNGTSYFQSGKPYEFEMKVIGNRKRLKSVAYHWLIEDYVSAVHDAGLVIKNIYEPRPLKSAAEKFPKWYRGKMDYPSYIIFEIEK